MRSWLRVVILCGVIPGAAVSCDQRGTGDTVSAQWSVDSVPALVIRSSEDTDSVTLAMVTGASRLPDGDILVSDVNDYGLLRFNSDGHLKARVGRKGAGPGEIEYAARLFRCGDSLLVNDIANRRISVFTTDVMHVRAFTFGVETAGRMPYQSACNSRGTFIHYGWENPRDIREGAYRKNVDFWLSPSDGSAGSYVGAFPGSERFGTVRGGGGSGPLPLGKQSVIAIGSDRAYIGTADRYEFLVVDLAGKVIDTLRRDIAVRNTTPDDIADAKAREKAGLNPRRAAAIDEWYATLPFPATLPAYAATLVDSHDLIWVQDFAGSDSPLIGWTVFDRVGSIVAALSLPANLEVYEIGEEYVLGRYLDPDVGEPEVRLYRLRRGTTPNPSAKGQP